MVPEKNSGSSRSTSSGHFSLSAPAGSHERARSLRLSLVPSATLTTPPSHHMYVCIEAGVVLPRGQGREEGIAPPHLELAPN
eukprot:1227708-Pleurochrysis_carterae.AAC.1